MPARLGQHFLVSAEIAARIVAAADVRAGEAIVEIGPGRGVLTQGLLQAGAAVTAVELDQRLCEGLSRRFADAPGLTLIHADWLKLDLRCLPSPAKVVSNLPYAVAAPILQRLLDWPGWSSAVLMFQKEVAERILAGPGARTYGVLSLSVLIKADAELVCSVAKSCFKPPPKVDSAVLRLARRPKPRLPEGVSEEAFFSVVKAAFSQRRKMAPKSISAVLKRPRPEVERAFAAAGLPLSARAEELSLEAFAALARSLRLRLDNS